MTLPCDCSGLGTNIGAAFNGIAPAAKIVAADKSLFIATSCNELALLTRIQRLGFCLLLHVLFRVRSQGSIRAARPSAQRLCWRQKAGAVVVGTGIPLYCCQPFSARPNSRVISP